MFVKTKIYPFSTMPGSVFIDFYFNHHMDCVSEDENLWTNAISTALFMYLFIYFSNPGSVSVEQQSQAIGDLGISKCS